MSGSSPAKAMTIGGVAELTVKNDVAGELSLSTAETQTLEYLADHNGEVRWDWNAVKQATREMVADLIEKGLVLEREYVTSALQLHGTLTLKLTDKGRNVVEIHRKRKIVAGEIKPMESAG